MNGPEHYRKAEDLLGKANSVSPDSVGRTNLMLAAQVHATLALTAATLGVSTSSLAWEWRDVAS